MHNPYGDLPLFPCFYVKPTEDRLERVIMRLFDQADKQLLNGHATQVQYDAWAEALDRWASSVEIVNPIFAA